MSGANGDFVYQANIEPKHRLVLLDSKPTSPSEQHSFYRDNEQKIWHIRIPSNYQKFDISNALDKLDEVQKDQPDNTSQGDLRLRGKLAIYVTVGSINSYGVAIVDDFVEEQPFKDRKSAETFISNLKSRENYKGKYNDSDFELISAISGTPGSKKGYGVVFKKEFKPLEGRRFGDQKSAEKFMVQLASTHKYKNRVLGTISGDDPSTKSGILESLVCLFVIAKAKKAAIVVPDYSSMSPNSKLIEDALNYVDFRGPVVSVSCDDQVASCEKTAMMHYQFGTEKHPRGILFARTTHSFQLCESPGVKHTDLYSTLGARLVAAISRPGPFQQSKEQRLGNGGRNSDSGDDENVVRASEGSNKYSCCKHNAVFVVAGGGVVGLRHMEQAVLVGMPIVVLEGSGRLCDYLPKLWVRRFATGFDAVKESNRFCEEIGFKETNDGTLGRQLCQVRRGDFRNLLRNGITQVNS